MIVRRVSLLSLIILAALAATGFAGDTLLMKVIADRVNLRARPTLSAEVVGQVQEGDILVAKSFKEEWVEVLPDDAIDFWVHTDFVKAGEVTSSKLNVRAGAGINYSVVGVLSRGDKVEVRDQFGEWLKIAPPYGSSLWVTSQFVELLDPDRPKRVKAVSQAPVPPAPAPVTRAAAKPSKELVQETSGKSSASEVQLKTLAQNQQGPPGLKLIPLEGQGQQVQKDGMLRKVGFMLNKPARFRLVTMGQRRNQTICYVRGNIEQLESFVGRHMTIRGRQYWAQGARYPIIIPDQIIPHGRP